MEVRIINRISVGNITSQSEFQVRGLRLVVIIVCAGGNTHL